MIDGSLISYWIGFGFSLFAVIVGVALGFCWSCKKGIRDILAGATLIAFLVFASNLTLILNQGYIERDDNITVEWSRFAYLIAITLVFSLIVAKYLWHELIFRWTALALLTMASTFLLFSVLSTGDAILAWGIISLILVIVGLLVVIFYSKRRDLCVFILWGLILVGLILYTVFAILSPAITYAFNWYEFDWAIVFVECFLLLIIPFYMVFTYISINCKCKEISEGCCDGDDNKYQMPNTSYHNPCNNNMSGNLKFVQQH
jgi:hypothetical protein